MKPLHFTFPLSYRTVPAALLSLFLSASALHASIIYWDPADVTIDASAVSQPFYVSLLTGEVTLTPLSGEGVFIFGDGDVFSDPSAGFLSVDMTIIANRGVVPNASSTTSPAAARFSANAVIDGADSSLWTHSFEVLQNNFAVAPDWSLSESLSGFIGLSLQISGGLHYGWASISRNGSEYTLLDFAYNSTADSQIAAGAVPEPSTLSGIGLCLILIWLFMLVKRHRMESKKNS